MSRDYTRTTRVRPLLASLAAIAAIGTAVTVANTPAHAEAIDSTLPSYCQGAGTDLINNPGTKTPVILVHGVGGKGGDWGSPKEEGSFADIANSASGATVVQPFNYDDGRPPWQNTNMQWVDKPESGGRLAKLIECVGRWSADNGGPGKVVLVGHSMGGLMIRWAYGQPAVDGHQVSEYIGKVITIATPNEGSDTVVGRLSFLRPDSPNLRILPTYAKDLPVYAIAGNVRDVYRNVGEQEPYKTTSRNHDGWVSTSSALAVTYDSPKYGGGTKTFNCDQNYERQVVKHRKKTVPIGLPYFVGDAPFCAHNNQLKSQIIANEVKKSVERYTSALPALPPSPGERDRLVGGLQFSLAAPTWLMDSCARGDWFCSVRDATNSLPYSYAEDQPNHTRSAFFRVEDISVYAGDLMSMHAWGMEDTDTSVVAFEWEYAPGLTVDGKASSFNLSVTNGKQRWQVRCFTEDKTGVCIKYESSGLYPEKGALEVLSTAKWVG